MGTLTVTSLIGSLRITLLDPSAVTWADADFLKFANEASRAACLLRPDLYTARAAIPVASGTLQAIPVGATALLRIEHNTVSGRACRFVDASLLDASAVFWRSATQETDVQEWAFDPRDRKRWLCLPPNNATGSVMALYGVVPPAIANVADPIPLDDIYEQVYLEFMAFKALSANTERQDPGKAAAAYGRFKEYLGINAQSVAAMLPKPGGAGAG